MRHLAVFFLPFSTTNTCIHTVWRCTKQASKQTEFLICYANHTLASRSHITQLTNAKLVCSYLYSCWFACERTMKTITMNVECCCCCCYCCCCVRAYLPWRNHSTVHIHTFASLSPFFAFSLSLALCFTLVYARTHSNVLYVVTMKRRKTTIPSGRLEAEYQIHATRTHMQTQHTLTHTQTMCMCERASVKQEEACKVESHHCQLCG